MFRPFSTSVFNLACQNSSLLVRVRLISFINENNFNVIDKTNSHDLESAHENPFECDLHLSQLYVDYRNPNFSVVDLTYCLLHTLHDIN